MRDQVPCPAVLLSDDPARCRQVYGQGRLERLARLVDLVPGIVTGAELPARADQLRAVRAVFSTWGLPRLGAPELACMPALEIVFYAAGSVRSFAPALLARGIRVVSAWAANAVPVAEFTVAQVLLSCKGYWRNTRGYTAPEARPGLFRGGGVFGETVGLIGAGMVGRAVIERLRPFELRIAVHDPYLSDAEARRLAVEKVSLDDLFARSYVVSNHLPNLPALRGVLHGGHFVRMRPNATFINTGRGAQVVEADLLAVLRERPDLTALLDVTWPEPPEAGSPLFALPNVQLSGHIAGSMNDEVVRMADVVLEEFERWAGGESLRWEVTAQRLKTMA